MNYSHQSCVEVLRGLWGDVLQLNMVNRSHCNFIIVSEVVLTCWNSFEKTFHYRTSLIDHITSESPNQSFVAVLGWFRADISLWCISEKSRYKSIFVIRVLLNYCDEFASIFSCQTSSVNHRINHSFWPQLRWTIEMTPSRCFTIKHC